ncbi:MAG: UDP-N-acetylmuramoyl-tripeptide--D-alanyl-D-alanine ligase [Bacilli bacterium]|nr:UDP-N-acetylmuramoyl-tripeptide--D-alanyl-D-alanine ligase [Bacilli bacterium]
MKIIIIILSSLFYLMLELKKNIHMLQQNFYNENNRYLKWGIKNISNILDYKSILILILNLINLFFQKEILLYVNILYLGLYLCEKKREKNTYYKIPLKCTKRVKRLYITNIILYLSLIAIYNLTKKIYLFTFIYSLYISISFLVVYLSNIINIPIEKIVFNHYKNKAVNKLSKQTNLEVIGITGSYGKTSSKSILNEILSVKYNPIATPKNFNTQYGLIITINNYINKFHDLFIAEMGAFKLGRIKILCNLVKPKYGIITRIGDSHLETFGSRENIQKGKFELIESLPSEGLAILNMDDEYQVNYKLKNKSNVKWISIDNKEADIIASDIKMDANGMSFNVYFKEDNLNQRFYTKLLGTSNIYNILGAITLAYHKNMTLEEIDIGIRKIKPVPHRLELKKNKDNIIIDDSYNSNPIGSKMALDVLSLMNGIKIVVTPGMIELGDKQYELNKKFGEYISNVANYVILVGQKQTKPILDGLKEKKYKEENIFIINDVREAFKIIDGINTKGKKYILLENDLPDIFNEN